MIAIIKHDIYVRMIYDIFRAVFAIMYALSFVLSAILLFKGNKFFWITVYVLISALSDIYLWFIPDGTYNHYAYAAGMVATGFALFMYFARTLRTRAAYILYILSFGLIITTYIKHKMWEPLFIMPERYVAGYYAIMAASAAYFLWQVIVLEKTKSGSKPQWFGAIFMVFYSLSMLCHSFLFGALLPKAALDSLYIVLYAINFVFELGKFIVFLLLFYTIVRR